MFPARTVIAVALTAAVVVGGVAASVRTAPATTARSVTTTTGQSVVPNGFNTASSSKSAADGMPVFTEVDLTREQKDTHTDFVRFLISWRKVEPQPGVYDQKYLDDVAERVGWYSTRGYKVMLDMHQDLWGSGITPSGDTGNGAPTWATYMDGMPVEQQDEWELYYLQPGVVRAFDNFWNTTGEHPELMQHYADAWAQVAARFAGDSSVVAFDLMNEPYGGTVEGPAFEAGPLSTMYQRTVDAIRKVDHTTWLCVEPQAFGYNWGLPSGLRKIDDPRDGSARIAFCPHLYPAPMDAGMGYGDNSSFVDGEIGLWTENTLRTAHKLGDVPVILGEYGLDTTQSGALDYIGRVHSAMDAAGIGTVYWSSDPGSWGPYDESGKPRNLVSAIDRAYPMTIAGDVKSWGVENGSLVIRLRQPASAMKYPGVGDATADGAATSSATSRRSTAYLPVSGFPAGFTVRGATTSSFDKSSRVLTFTIAADATVVVISPAG